MASEHQAAGGRHSNPLFDELRWVIQIRHSLEDDADDDDTGIPVSVFNVPKPLQVIKPEAYSPQLTAFGPYHHWRPELYEMERYKLAAAKRTQRHFHGGLKLEQLVQQVTKLERKIRAHYHRYLDFSGETLSWMMVVDASFVLEFLQIYAAGKGDGRALQRVSSRMSHLVDFAGRKSAHNLVLRDMLMLENQIPLFLLRKALDAQCATTQDADDALVRMLSGFVKELCPFKMMASFPAVEPAKHAHLLELLYSVLVPRPEGSAEGNNDDEDDNGDIEEADAKGAPGEPRPASCNYVRQLSSAAWGIVSGLKSGPMQHITKPIAFAVKAPWKMLTALPGFSALRQPMDSLFFPQEGSSKDPTTPLMNMSGPPLIEEIMIPSVSELVAAGVKFAPTTGGLDTVAFDTKTVTFHLPVISLDGNTEVLLRNLVAYEASSASGPVIFTRYTELMNGIVDTDEDVALLRQRGIVLNHMKSDAAVAKLLNGMSKSVRLTRVPFLDKVIEDVNKHYNSRWRVKTKRFMRKYVFSSWQFLTFVAAIMMLLLTTLQAFCSVYTCARWFGVVTVTKE